jgi:hypothetical protein
MIRFCEPNYTIACKAGDLVIFLLFYILCQR